MCTVVEIIHTARRVRSQVSDLDDLCLIAVRLDQISEESLCDEFGNDILFSSVDPPNDSTSQDMLWAAGVFKNILVPFILSGGTKQQLTMLDDLERSPDRLRRFTGAWDQYLGGRLNIPFVGLQDGIPKLSSGRYRTSAAQIVGIKTLPMWTYPRTDIQEEIDKGEIEFPTVDTFLRGIGTPL